MTLFIVVVDIWWCIKRLTSRAQARGADDVLRDSGTGLSCIALATREAAIPLRIELYALRAFHNWTSGLMRFPRTRPTGFRLYTTEPNSFRNQIGRAHV